ncbi:helix-turn-helix domain-containing protein [Spongiimicrobium salis]|uniref:helix-turn-helix domain-containing protein n=1 Tax=Spongiimicrobium salis TaxID=1667022 RepID=UPI00374D5353
MEKTILSIFNSEQVLRILNTLIKGNISEDYGQYTLKFDNEVGKGNIKAMEFENGLSYLNFEVFFNNTFRLTLDQKEFNPILFLFQCDGKVSFEMKFPEKKINLHKHQNSIINMPKFSQGSLIFPKQTAIDINVISIEKNIFLEQKNIYLDFLSPCLKGVFTGETHGPFMHLGKSNVRIANQINEFKNECLNSGLIKTLELEGRLKLVLATHISEHESSINEAEVLYQLNDKDLEKIHKISSYIFENIRQPIDALLLSTKFNFPLNKLQRAFLSVYSKTIEAYIADIKLKMAKYQIENSNDSIAEVMYDLGFRKRSVFYKVFMEKYGMNPVQLRTNKEC